MEVTETVTMEKKVIHINRVAEPTRSPAPTAPSQAAEKAPDVNTPAEPESKTDLRVKERWIRTIQGWSPKIRWIVDRHINHLGVRRLDFNGRLPPFRLGPDGHLSVRLQFARLAGLGSQPLHGIHDIGLLSEKCVPEIGCPTNVCIQPGDRVRENDKGLDTGVPVLLTSGFHQLGAFQVAILLQPLASFDDLERITGSHQDLAE